MSSPLRLRLWRIAALAITVGLVVILLAPGSRLPVAALAEIDELVHLLSYLLVGLSWHRAGLRPRWVVLLGLALAAGTEAAQGMMGWGRQADAIDLAADLVGLLVGLGLSVAAGGPGRR